MTDQMKRRAEDTSDMSLAISEHHYVIKKHAAMLGEIKDICKANADGVSELKLANKDFTDKFHKHVEKEDSFEKVLTDLSVNMEKVIDYTNKMEYGAWLMSKIKVIAMWITAVSAGGWSASEILKYFNRHQNIMKITKVYLAIEKACNSD